MSLILHGLVQTNVTHYKVTSIIPHYYSSTILYHPVNSSFTFHITHCVHKPHPRVSPTTSRTNYTFPTLFWAYLTLTLLYWLKKAIFPDDYYVFLCAIQQTQASYLVYLYVFLLTTSLPFSPYSTPARFPSTIRTTWLFFPASPFPTCDTPGISRLPHPWRESCINFIKLLLRSLTAQRFSEQVCSLDYEQSHQNLVKRDLSFFVFNVFKLSIFVRAQKSRRVKKHRICRASPTWYWTV